MKSTFRFTFVSGVACFSPIVAASGMGGIGVAGEYFGAFLLWVFLSLVLAFFWYKKTGLGWVLIHCPLILLSLVQAKTIGLIVYTESPRVCSRNSI